MFVTVIIIITIITDWCVLSCAGLNEINHEQKNAMKSLECLNIMTTLLLPYYCNESLFVIKCFSIDTLNKQAHEYLGSWFHLVDKSNVHLHFLIKIT